MLIRLGFEAAFDFTKPAAVVLMAALHPSQLSKVRRPEQFTVLTVPERFARNGDPHEGIDDAVGSLDGLLALAAELGPAEKAPRGAGGSAGSGGTSGSGRRQSAMPLVEVARTKTTPEALAALEEWKGRHSGLVPALHPADVLIDGMRGSSSLWYRVRINLQHVPEAERPPQEALLANYDPWAGKQWPDRA